MLWGKLHLRPFCVTVILVDTVIRQSDPANRSAIQKMRDGNNTGNLV